MRGLGLAIVLAVAVGSAGCGSSGGGWQVVKTVKASGSSAGFVDNVAVSRPAQIEVKVETKPSIQVRASYAFVCGEYMSNQDTPTHVSAAAKTPTTVPLIVPVGPPASCRLNVLVRKSGAADMTVTVRMRGESTTTTGP